MIRQKVTRSSVTMQWLQLNFFFTIFCHSNEHEQFPVFIGKSFILMTTFELSNLRASLKKKKTLLILSAYQINAYNGIIMINVLYCLKDLRDSSQPFFF